MTVPEVVRATSREVPLYNRQKADGLRRLFAQVADMVEQSEQDEAQAFTATLNDLLRSLVDRRRSFTAAALHAAELTAALKGLPLERDRIEREFTAVHEASHAVGAVRLEVPIDRVTIVPSGLGDSASLGHVHLVQGSPTEPAWDDVSRLVLERYALVDLSGCAGEDQFGPPGASRESWEIHRADARRTLLPLRPFLGHSVLVSHVAALEDRARAFVAANWPAIDAVRGALLDRDTLSGDEVREIVERSGI